MGLEDVTVAAPGTSTKDCIPCPKPHHAPTSRFARFVSMAMGWEDGVVGTEPTQPPPGQGH